ncbi:MAG: hypothetical protein KDE22_18390 [Rhodobacterales bacterium]|nr:hypothetical protein [Rhodobacterales bacterium]
MTDTMTESRKEARKYAWDWFIYHAKQRLDAFRFFLIITALLFTGYVKLYLEGHDYMAVLVCMIIMVTSILFYRLDVRNKQLIQVALAYIRDEDIFLSNELKNEKIMIATVSERDRRFIASFTSIFRLFFILIFFLGFMGLVVSSMRINGADPEGQSEIGAVTGIIGS